MAETLDSKAAKAAPMDRLWAENDDSRVTGDPSLVVDVAGFEGPLDLLLHLARNQKVDLARISILALAEQYLTFVETARALRLELAADYLVMAAWLAFLKSKLLIPKQPGDEGESGEELAAVLQFRLKRLEAMRDAAARLVNRNRLGRDVFARGMPEMVIVEKRNAYSASLYDLLTAYAQQRQKQAITNVTIARRGVWSLKDARDILTRLVGSLRDWTALDSFLIDYLTSPEERRTAIASSFAATLELVREGKIEVRQDEAFAPLYLRGRPKHAGNQGSRGGIMSERANASVIPFKVEDETEEGAAGSTEARIRRAAAYGRSRCAWPRRSCSPAPSRSAKSSSRRGCPTASTLPPRWPSCSRSMRGAASIWCGSAMPGRSAPPAISPS